MLIRILKPPVKNEQEHDLHPEQRLWVSDLAQYQVIDYALVARTLPRCVPCSYVLGIFTNRSFIINRIFEF